MAIRPLRLNADVLSNGFLNALALVALAIASFPAGARGAQGATPLSADSQPVPTNIRNAPFSAMVSTQYDHELANGNHIHRETRGRVARDSQGRVRTETEIRSPFRGGESSDNIAIQDPVLRVVIHLDPHAKTARVFHLSEGQPAAVKTTDGSPLIESTGSNAVGAPSDAKPNVVSLGTKLIEGVRAVGTRTTRTMATPLGEPVTAVTEVWFSPELQMVLLSVSDDGESGRSVMRVTNIRRTAPNAELFRVPPEYTVKDSNPIATAIRH